MSVGCLQKADFFTRTPSFRRGLCGGLSTVYLDQRADGGREDHLQTTGDQKGGHYCPLEICRDQRRSLEVSGNRLFIGNRRRPVKNKDERIQLNW